MSRVILDMGHTGRTGGRPGAVHGDLREVDIVRAYVCHAAQLLEAGGVTVELAGHGSYHSRQRYAHARRTPYVPCHVNAGWRPGYGASVFVGDAPGSQHLGAALRRPLVDLLGSARIWDADPALWPGPAALVKHTGDAPAVVYEPVFIDNPAHRDLCQQPRLIGEALAEGLLSYFRGDA